MNDTLKVSGDTWLDRTHQGATRPRTHVPQGARVIVNGSSARYYAQTSGTIN